MGHPTGFVDSTERLHKGNPNAETFNVSNITISGLDVEKRGTALDPEDYPISFIQVLGDDGEYGTGDYGVDRLTVKGCRVLGDDDGKQRFITQQVNLMDSDAVNFQNITIKDNQLINLSRLCAVNAEHAVVTGNIFDWPVADQEVADQHTTRS